MEEEEVSTEALEGEVVEQEEIPLSAVQDWVARHKEREAIMFTPMKEEYEDPKTGEKKKRQVKYYPDLYKTRIGKSYEDYEQARQINLFEDIMSYEDGGPGEPPQLSDMGGGEIYG